MEKSNIVDHIVFIIVAIVALMNNDVTLAVVGVGFVVLNKQS